MFSVYSIKNGKPFKHEVKVRDPFWCPRSSTYSDLVPASGQALEIIYRKFPEFYNATNSIHIDDLSRNFVLK